MPERESSQILSSELARHPAVRSWLRSGARVEPPRGVERLKRKAGGEVYRLAGAGPGGSAVIAKRCRPEKARIERKVFGEVLPRSGLSRLEIYGFVEENDGAFCWLFLEDGGPQRYSPQSEQHRMLAARWLAAFHTAPGSVSAVDGLPRLGPEHYLGFLREIRRRIPRTARMLDPVHREVLNGIREQCAVLEASWGRIAAFCDPVPSTLVHGDCLAKNVHVRTTPTGPEVVFFDWGGAGRGLPATDLGQLGLPRHVASMGRRDHSTYSDLVRERWPGLDVRKVEKLAALGQTFWALKVIRRELDAFSRPWATVEDTVRNLGIYGSILAESTGSCGWSG